jgi:hypothetical protein
MIDDMTSRLLSIKEVIQQPAAAARSSATLREEISKVRRMSAAFRTNDSSQVRYINS